MPTLICDLGGVLLTEVDPQRRLDTWSAGAGGALGVTSGAELDDDALRAFRSGHLSEDEYCRQLRDRLRWTGSDEDLVAGWIAEAGVLNLDVLEALSGLKEKGWHLVGATDASPWDGRAVEAQFGWALTVFDRVVTSAEAGACRPDPRFFADLRGAAGVGPRLYVDDDPHNVSGARRAGLDAHLFTTASSLQIACRQFAVTVS
ncbi:MAG: 2-haloacid dehalogenase [Actinomycetota bacterium]|nr:2-haloacid dehalogenase [Actinomycetota bacterium]